MSDTRSELLGPRQGKGGQLGAQTRLCVGCEGQAYLVVAGAIDRGRVIKPAVVAVVERNLGVQLQRIVVVLDRRILQGIGEAIGNRLNVVIP